MEINKKIGLTYINLKNKKYELVKSIGVYIPELKDVQIDTSIHPYIYLKDGNLLVKAGYHWDGATCVPANRDNLRASLFHDALYELMQLGLLDRKYRDVADRMFRKICIEDGMSEFWADRFYEAVKMFGESHTLPNKENYEIIEI